MCPSSHCSDRKGHNACGALTAPVHPLLFCDPDKEVQVPSLSCLPEVLCPLVLWAHPCTPRLAHNQLSCVLTGLWWVQIISAISPSFSFLQSVTASAVLPTAGVAPLLCHPLPWISLTALVPQTLHKCVCSYAQMWHLTPGLFSQRQLWCCVAVGSFLLPGCTSGEGPGPVQVCLPKSISLPKWVL